MLTCQNLSNFTLNYTPMNTKSRIIFLLIALLIPYLLMSFITMDLNPVDWQPKYRAIMIFFSFMMISFSGMIKK